MESTRFDRLARSIGEAPSRRRLLATAASATLAAAGLRANETVAKKKKKGRKRCKIEAGSGRCIHGVCAISCDNPGGCSAQLGNLPKCGPNNLDCGCAKLLNGNTACVGPRGGADLCARTPCQSNKDCVSGNACVKIPGCCPDRTQVCAFACQ